MANYEEIEYAENFSEIVKDVRDKQLSPEVNTVFDCVIETIIPYKENIVEIVLQLRLQSYPKQLIDKYTFYSQQRHVIKDINGVFFLDSWDDRTVDLFAHVYFNGQKRFVNGFKERLGETMENFYSIGNSVPDHFKQRASEILQFYIDKLSGKI